MRVTANLTTNTIIEVGKTPDIGYAVPYNGRYSVAIPEGSDVDIRPETLIFEPGGHYAPGTIVHQAYEGLLAQYPMYGNILFNPLLTAQDAADWDLGAGMTISGPPPLDVLWARGQIGRHAGTQAGNAPNATAIFGQNNQVNPPNPGLLITDTQDIGPLTDGKGADEFMVWWQIYEFDISHDMSTEWGSWAGQNNPALRSIKETFQEPPDFEVSLSINDGASFWRVGRLEPINFCSPGTKLRLSFLNRNPSKVYLAAWAIMF
jgi:hypothetical protein